MTRRAAVACELIAHAGLSHSQREFGISQIRVGKRLARVTENAIARHPFCTLRHFANLLRARRRRRRRAMSARACSRANSVFLNRSPFAPHELPYRVVRDADAIAATASFRPMQVRWGV